MLSLLLLLAIKTSNVQIFIFYSRSWIDTHVHEMSFAVECPYILLFCNQIKSCLIYLNQFSFGFFSFWYLPRSRTWCFVFQNDSTLPPLMINRTVSRMRNNATSYPVQRCSLQHLEQTFPWKTRSGIQTYDLLSMTRTYDLWPLLWPIPNWQHSTSFQTTAQTSTVFFIIRPNLRRIPSDFDPEAGLKHS